MALQLKTISAQCYTAIKFFKPKVMFSFFKKKSEKEKLQEQYQKLMKESFDLSKIDRTKADAKVAEANLILEKIEKLDKQ
jgi:TRAP-type mannitol/chloroaromatic compound transport system substrate-binding protein